MRRLLIAAVALAAGCTVGPDYEAPEAKLPESWSGGLETGTPEELAGWWGLFRDPVLDDLVSKAVRSNLDIGTAELRVIEARAQTGIVNSALFPTLNASAGATRSRVSENGVSGLIPGDLYRDLFKAGFDASWELDLFGGRRRAFEAAVADVEAAIYDRRAATIVLLGDLGRNYVNLRGLQRRLAVLDRSISGAGETLKLSRARFDAGLVGELDVVQAKLQLAALESQRPLLETERVRSIHRLGILLGGEPGALASELATAAPVPVPPAKVAVGLPATLLRRRPDIAAAERRLAASTARVGVAIAEGYPTISLTGAFGVESLESGDLMKMASRTWSVGPTIRWPAFSADRIRANTVLQQARTHEAFIAWRKAVLGALEEVENGIVAFIQEGARRQSLREAEAAASRGVELARELNGKGLVPFFEVLRAESTLYELQGRLAESDAALSLSVVALYKSLGGGWDVAEALAQQESKPE